MNVSTNKQINPLRYLASAGTIVLLSLSAGAGCCGLSPAYYDDVNTSTASLLRSTLNATLSAGVLQLGYDNTWEPLRDIDEATTSADHVRLIYGGDVRAKISGTDADGSPSMGGWNREHMFPQSFFNQDEPMRSDVHALYPSDTDVNSRRSNSPYDVVTAPTYQDVFGNKATSSVFEPADVDKGRAARAVLYMDVRYEGLNGEPNLTVTNSYPGGTGAGQMAFLTTLLNWHRQFPPTAEERARNYKAYRYQQNANPFVDHPEWVDDVFGGPAWTPQDNNTLTLAADRPATRTIAAGTANVPVLRLPTETVGQEVHLAVLTFYKVGTIADNEVSQIELWYDVDADGEVGPEDSRLASGSFTGGIASLALSHPFYLATGSNPILVTVDIPVWSTAGATVGVSLSDDGIELSANGGQDNIAPYGPIASNEFEIGITSEPLAGLVISEVFEGSQGNLKYLELYNNTTQTINLATSGISLRRFTNGNFAPTNIALTTGSIDAGDFYVLANNSSDFQTAFGFAPDGTDLNIAHNGNDCYDIYRSSTDLVIDAFAPDRVGSAADFAVDRAAHRVPQALPNSGNWGFPIVSNSPDGSLTPSGLWRVRTITPGNANAAIAGSPGTLQSNTGINEWKDFETPGGGKAR